jgi:hypothetical protein
VVSQTQESAVIPDSPTNLLVPACDALPKANDGLPTAGNTAIAEMTAGHTNKDDGIDYKCMPEHTKMVLFNDNIGKHKTIKLTATSVFNFLHQGFVKLLLALLLMLGRHTISLT